MVSRKETVKSCCVNILDDVKFNQSLRPLIIDIFPSCIKIEADDQILHQLLGDYNPILDNPDIIFKNKDEILRSEEAKNDSIYSMNHENYYYDICD